MAKFNVTVVRTEEYEIEIDESIWTKEEIKNWGDVFWGGRTLEDVASSLGIAWMREDASYHKEGFGYVQELDAKGNKKSVPYRDEKGKYCNLPEGKYAKGLTIKPIIEDEYEAEAIQLKS